MTVTNSTAVLWQETGNAFTSEADAYIWVDGDGNVHKAYRIDGLGYVLAVDQDDESPTDSGENIVTWGSGTVKLLLSDP